MPANPKEALRQDLDDRSKVIIEEQLPQRIQCLVALLERFQHAETLLVPLHGAPASGAPSPSVAGAASKKRKIADEDTPTQSILNDHKLNEDVVTLLNDVKAEILNAVEIFQNLKLWVQLHVPRIEDGNNFGVSVQVSVLNVWFTVLRRD